MLFVFITEIEQFEGAFGEFLNFFGCFYFAEQFEVCEIDVVFVGALFIYGAVEYDSLMALVE